MCVTKSNDWKSTQHMKLFFTQSFTWLHISDQGSMQNTLKHRSQLCECTQGSQHNQQHEGSARWLTSLWTQWIRSRAFSWVSVHHYSCYYHHHIQDISAASFFKHSVLASSQCLQYPHKTLKLHRSSWLLNGDFWMFVGQCSILAVQILILYRLFTSYCV